MSDDSERPVGSDPSVTVLYAQVRDVKPRMSIDEEGYLRAEGWPGAAGKVFLGDVAQAALRALGPHDPPRFTEQPGYDEQRWELKSNANDLTLTITSREYWGFGLFAICFLNKIEISGPLALRARCVHDLVASLGRDPWEASWLRRFEKASGCDSSQHKDAWGSLVARAREDMGEEVNQLEDALRALRGADQSAEGVLDAAELALEEAKAALADRNAPAVERALGRASSAIIEADPSTGVRSTERMAQRSTAVPSAQKPEAVDAKHLLDEVPFVDLSEEE